MIRLISKRIVVLFFLIKSLNKRLKASNNKRPNRNIIENEIIKAPIYIPSDLNMLNNTAARIIQANNPQLQIIEITLKTVNIPRSFFANISLYMVVWLKVYLILIKYKGRCYGRTPALIKPLSIMR